MNLIRKIYQFIKREHVAYTYENLADDPEFWTMDDAIALKTFFSTEPGQKMRARLNNLTFRSAIKACSEPVNGDYHRGIARGILITVQSIEKDFPPAVGQTAEPDESAEQGQAELAVL
jgi:hypothetical protein